MRLALEPRAWEGENQGRGRREVLRLLLLLRLYAGEVRLDPRLGEVKHALLLPRRRAERGALALGGRAGGRGGGGRGGQGGRGGVAAGVVGGGLLVLPPLCEAGVAHVLEEGDLF